MGKRNVLKDFLDLHCDRNNYFFVVVIEQNDF